jgi:hypothetical protein
MQKEVKRPGQISIKAVLFKCDAVWNHFPLNVYKCDAIISKHNMLFQNFKIPGCYLNSIHYLLLLFFYLFKTPHWFYLILKQELFFAKMHQWLWYFILSIQYKTVLICFIYIFAGQHILLFCDAFNFNKLHNLVRTI